MYIVFLQFQGFALCATMVFAFYAYFYFDHLHFHVTHAYAHLGYPSAQHQVGQRYLHGEKLATFRINYLMVLLFQSFYLSNHFSQDVHSCVFIDY